MKRIISFIAVLTLGLWITQVFHLPFFKGVIPGNYMMISDLADLVITLPFMVIILFLINGELKNNLEFPGDKLEKTFNFFKVVLLAAFIEGHGIHLVANSINILYASRGVYPEDLGKLVYFYDEVLGHQILFTGLLGLLALTAIEQFWSKESWETNVTGNTVIVSCGLFTGVLLSLALIEGQSVNLGFLFSAINLALVIFYIFGRKRKLLANFILLYILVFSVVNLLFLSLWGIHFNGFPQLSELGVL